MNSGIAAYILQIFQMLSMSIVIGTGSSIVGVFSRVVNMHNDYEAHKDVVQKNAYYSKYDDTTISGNEVLSAIIALHYIEDDSVRVLNVSSSQGNVFTLEDLRNIIPVDDYSSNYVIKDKVTKITIPKTSSSNFNILQLRDDLGIRQEDKYKCIAIRDEVGTIAVINFIKE